jgi:hypothetical protein
MEVAIDDARSEDVTRRAHDTRAAPEVPIVYGIGATSVKTSFQPDAHSQSMMAVPAVMGKLPPRRLAHLPLETSCVPRASS